MAVLAFSQEWASAWCAALASSSRYREVAAEWEGSVGLVVEPHDEEPGRAVILDLRHGECRSALATSADETAEADFVFQSDIEGWRHIFTGQGSPIMALLSGRIRLVRGDPTRLLPYAEAAKELLELIPGGLLPDQGEGIL